MGRNWSRPGADGFALRLGGTEALGSVDGCLGRCGWGRCYTIWLSWVMMMFMAWSTNCFVVVVVMMMMKVLPSWCCSGISWESLGAGEHGCRRCQRRRHQAMVSSLSVVSWQGSSPSRVLWGQGFRLVRCIDWTEVSVGHRTGDSSFAMLALGQFRIFWGISLIMFIILVMVAFSSLVNFSMAMGGGYLSYENLNSW